MLKYISLLMVILCLSCSSKQTEKAENGSCITVDLARFLESDKDNEIFLSTLTDSLEYIPLQTPEDLPVDILMSVKMSSENIFVLDRRQCLFRFDRKGRFLNLIGSRGKGPKEYISAVDFEVDEANDAVYVFDIFQRKVKAYRMSGAFWKDISVPDGVESVALMGDSCFIGYRPWYRATNEADQCVVFEESTEVVDTILFDRKDWVDEVKVDLFRMPDFSQLSSTSRFCMPFESAIYSISRNYEISKEVEFEMGKHLLPVEVSMNNELYNKNLDAPYVFELKANRHVDFVYMSFFYQKKHYRVVYDINAEEFYTVFIGREPDGIKNDFDDGASFWPMWFASDNMIGVVASDALDMDYTNPSINDLYNDFKEYDNPILQIIYRSQRR